MNASRRSIITLIFITAGLFIVSCTKNLQKETVIYDNDFEKPDTTIRNYKYTTFNGSKVLGRFGTGGFEFKLKNLGSHDLLRVSFDLYIHDKWKGNSNTGITDSSDIWIMNLDGYNNIYTTFSNGGCNKCSFQSYPASYPFENNPAKANAMQTNLAGPCALENVSGGTTRYTITRTIYHTANTFELDCYGQLFSHNKALDPACDASWSIDNLTVTSIQFRD